MENSETDVDTNEETNEKRNEERELEHQRMRWASRRGMLELDLILEPFVSHHYAKLGPDARLEYRRLMECQDQELFGWFLKREVPQDAGLAEMVSIIVNSRG